MPASAFRFEYDVGVSLTEAEQSLHLAMYSVEGLFGSARIRLDAAYQLDDAKRAISVDASNEVGAAVVRVFTGLLIREFGEASFAVRPVHAGVAAQPVAAVP